MESKLLFSGKIRCHLIIATWFKLTCLVLNSLILMARTLSKCKYTASKKINHAILYLSYKQKFDERCFTLYIWSSGIMQIKRPSVKPILLKRDIFAFLPGYCQSCLLHLQIGQFEAQDLSAFGYILQFTEKLCTTSEGLWN